VLRRHRLALRLGYLHRMLLHHWKVLDGATAEAVDGSEYIYDPNGNQIFP
jgi:hypothetical protein